MRKHHPYAEIFPMMPRKKVQELADDIKANGLRIPIVLDKKGQILDGRNREVACAMAGVEPEYEVFEGTEKEELEFVLSNNLHRRHPTKSQLSMVAARLKPIHEQLAKARQSAAGGRKKDRKALPENFPEAQKGDSRDMAGAGLPVSGRLISHAENVIAKGIPEICQAVDNGALAVSAAAVVADLPPEEQLKIMSSGGAPAVSEAASVIRRTSRGRVVANEVPAPAPPVPDQGRPPASPDNAPTDEPLMTLVERAKASSQQRRKEVIDALLLTLPDEFILRVQEECQEVIQRRRNRQHPETQSRG